MTTSSISREEPWPFERAIILTIAALYAIAFAVVLVMLGPWEAARTVIAEGVILALWLWIARRMLGGAPDFPITIKRPTLELGIALLLIALAVAQATLHYSGVRTPPLRWFGRIVLYLPAVIALVMGYRYETLGLQMPWGRAWLAALAIIIVNLVVGLVGGIVLPPGEAPLSSGADLADGINGTGDILRLLVQIMLVAAIPEELAIRVYLQPRLARFLPVGWAILVQAVIFGAVHLPQQLLSRGNPLPLALAYTVLIPSNGIMAGYLWHKTRSLPLLVFVHLFAYARLGL